MGEALGLFALRAPEAMRMRSLISISLLLCRRKKMSAQSNQEKGQLQQALSAVVAALRQGLGDKLVAVVLFGSRARGDATEAGDWDVLVIARQLPSSPLQRHFQLTTLLPVEWRGQVSLLSHTPEGFDARVTSLMLDIARRYRTLRPGRLRGPAVGCVEAVDHKPRTLS